MAGLSSSSGFASFSGAAARSGDAGSEKNVGAGDAAAGHARAETVASGVGDRSPNLSIQAFNDSRTVTTDAGVHQMLSGFLIHNATDTVSPGSVAIPDNDSAALLPHSGYIDSMPVSAKNSDGSSLLNNPEFVQRLSQHFSTEKTTATGTDKSDVPISERPEFAARIKAEFAKADGRGLETIKIPDSHELQTQSAAELKSTFEQNQSNLEGIVGKNLNQLQANYLGFHGTDQSGVSRIEGTSTGKPVELYLATSGERSVNAREWIANTAKSLNFASSYATDRMGQPISDGKIAVIDMGHGDARGSNPAVRVHLADSDLLGGAHKAGETQDQVNLQSEPEKLKGYLDPSHWQALTDVSQQLPTSQESFERSTYAAGIRKQAMVKDLLAVLRVGTGIDDGGDAN